jgi:type II secretory ATPase GspE/PulE/Tfp pilus assembly ATPase PilB-like protein
VLAFEDFVAERLVDQGRISPEDLASARKKVARSPGGLLDALVEVGLMEPKALAAVCAVVCECPFVDIDSYTISFSNTELMPRSICQRALAFPLFDVDGIVTVGMADPLDLDNLDRIRAVLKVDVEPVLCERRAIERLIERAYSLAAGPQATDESAEAESESDGGPIVSAVNQILAQAIEENASDVHLGPDEHELHLRFRIDGVLQRRQGPSLAMHPGIVQRLKVMAHLDLTQTRRPQDGKFRFRHAGRAIDIRVSIIPTVTGENVVLRILGAGALLKGFADLGLDEGACGAMKGMIAEAYGMILVTGPTGSGKTTTLYTALKRLNTPDRNILTIEDPVELRLPLARQIQVSTDIGLTFASALRSILRQDPDVILVGEIRDEETARIALQASLTGHLVLSTLHTNDAPGAIARLRDFGCPSFAINSALLGVLAQRLLRRLCPECAAPDSPEQDLLEALRVTETRGAFKRAVGCDACGTLGYRGRIGAFEILLGAARVRTSIEGHDSTAALRRIAIEHGMKPLWRDALQKAELGLTTLEEVRRVAAASIDDDMDVVRAHRRLSA